MRDNIILKCTECGEENYINTKNKKSHPERVEFKKYCPDETRNHVFEVASKLANKLEQTLHCDGINILSNVHRFKSSLLKIIHRFR